MGSVKEKAVTINDIARLADVSKRTVSRVINGSDKVGDKTRKLVLKIIEETNFMPNTQARGLASSRSYLIGMLYDSPTIFISDAQIGVSSVCNELGYDLVVHPCDVKSDKLLDEVEFFVRRSRVDGLIIVPPVSQHNGLAEKLRSIGCDYVRFTSDETCDRPEALVVTNQRKVMKDVVNHLVDHNHKRFAFVGGPEDSIATLKRLEAYQLALQDRGFDLPQNMICFDEHTFDTGYALAKRLLSVDEPPTAIFAFNDEVAIGVVKAAKELNIDVPGQLSVVGFDGTWLASHFIPTLSSVNRPVHEMAVLATKKLVLLIGGDVDAAKNQELYVTPTFVSRESSGPCRA